MRWPHALDVTSPSYRSIKYRLPVRPCLGTACCYFRKHSIAHECFSKVDSANSGSAVWIPFRRVAQTRGTACRSKISTDPGCELARARSNNARAGSPRGRNRDSVAAGENPGGPAVTIPVVDFFKRAELRRRGFCCNLPERQSFAILQLRFRAHVVGSGTSNVQPRE